MEEKLVSYLLGELPEDEQIRLESEYFGDEEKFNLLKATRDDLMDAYVGGKLSQKQRKQFETHVLNSPGQSQFVDFAEVLADHLADKEQEIAPAAVAFQQKEASIWRSVAEFFRAKNFALQFSFAAVAVIALFGSIWLMREISQLRSKIDQLQAEGKASPQTDPKLLQQIEAAKAQNDRLAQELDAERTKREELEAQAPKKQEPETGPIANTLAFILLPDVLRSDGGSNRLIVPSSVPTVELRLSVKGNLNYSAFQALLSNANGDQIWHKGGLKLQKQGASGSILLKLPSKILAEDDYTIDLRAAAPSGNYENVSVYTFRVLRKN